MSAEPWIEWGGGKMPVVNYLMVEVKHRDGDVGFGPACHWIDRWSNGWEHTGPVRGEDIIAYRVVQS